jgi:FkbM family methyltransferase
MKHIDGWWCPDILSGPGKYVKRAAVIAYALQHWSGPRRRVIQAGAHIGIWPRMLAQYFTVVVCVEPEPENYACLVRNIHGSSRITGLHGALGEATGTVDLNVQPHSTGGHHVATRLDRPYVTVPQYAIDDWEYDDVSAVFLDVEGFEIPALMGAAATIERCQPLLVLEDNSCAQRYGHEPGALGAYLAQRFGYEAVGRYGEDVIYLPATREHAKRVLSN